MAYYCQGYDVVDAICQTSLAELKVSSGHEPYRCYVRLLAFEVQRILQLRQLHAKDVDPFHLHFKPIPLDQIPRVNFIVTVRRDQLQNEDIYC